MAKKDNIAPTGGVTFVTVAPVDQADSLVKFAGFDLNVGDMSSKTVAYLLQYGFAQSMQDATAGRTKKWKEDHAKEFTNDEGEVDDDAMEEALAEFITGLQKARYDAIVNATIGHRTVGVPKMSGIDKVMWDYAVEVVKGAFAANKFVWPKKAADYQEVVQKYLGENRDEVEAEARRRMALPVVKLDLSKFALKS